jgi:hypothetical protein
VKVINKNSGGNPNSHTPAHESSAAVASFRTWPSSLTYRK